MFPLGGYRLKSVLVVLLANGKLFKVSHKDCEWPGKADSYAAKMVKLLFYISLLD